MMLGHIYGSSTITTLLLVVIGVFMACKPDSANLRTSDNHATQSQDEDQQAITLLTDKEVKQFFITNCEACHGISDKGVLAPNYSSWPMTEDELTVAALEVSFFAPSVYQSLVNKIVDQPGPLPKPMPDGGGQARGKDAHRIKSILAWFQVNLPLVVAEAEDQYGMSIDRELAMNIDFICKEPLSLRMFVNRFTSTVFNRPPHLDEWGQFDGDTLDQPVTPQHRAQLVSRLWSHKPWRDEFEQQGLLKLARAIGGAPALAPFGSLDTAVIDDLKLEFYRQLLAHYRSADYSAIFTRNDVWVTENTAPLYGCQYSELMPINGEPRWRRCTMQPPRAGFFTTIGYLASRPQSFLQETNNYGRVASMYFTLAGQGFRAAVNEPPGDGKVQPLPSCLETDDSRYIGGAPRGSAAVPLFGNNCQGCHISRNLAAGSVLFRDFATTGAVYTPENLATLEPTLLAQATAAGWTAETKPVDTAFLQRLLTIDKKACTPSAVKGQKPTIHKTVNDLAEHLMSNKKRLVRGFVRHAQRAFLNSESVNFDLVYNTVQRVDESDKVTVQDLIEVYLQSETFACQAR